MLDPNVQLHNIAEFFPAADGAGWGVCRVPLALRAQLNENAQANATQATGCELRFNLLSESARITLEMTERPAIAEVYNGPFLTAWHAVGTSPTEIVVTQPARLVQLCAVARERRLPFDPRLVRVVLPWRPPVRLHAVAGEFAPPRAEQAPETRYLAYGSSITHGNSSVGATGMWAQHVARRLGVDLINLGFGGGAHCEAALADYIAARDDWDFATLELGINMVQWLDVDAFAARVDYFVRTVAGAHRDRWVFCIDMFPFYMDFDPTFTQNHAYRAVVRETVARLNLPRLVHVDGRDLLRNPAGLSADLVHPAPAGMEEIGRNLAEYIAGRVDLLERGNVGRET